MGEKLAISGIRKELPARYLPTGYRGLLGHTVRSTVTAENFCKFIKEFCAAVDAGKRTLRPLLEFGYTNNTNRRLYHHRTHNSSNYLLNLTHAICREYFPAYGLKQFVIHHIWDPEHAWVTEILFNRIGGGSLQEGTAVCRLGQARSTIYTNLAEPRRTSQSHGCKRRRV